MRIISLINLLALFTWPNILSFGKSDSSSTDGVNLDLIQGDWTCVKSERIIMEEIIPSDVHLQNIRMSGDTAYFFEFPCRYYQTNIIGLESSVPGTLNLSNVKLIHDTLIIYFEDSDMQGYRYYTRDTFDTKIISSLLRDSIYIPSLVGTWYLKTQGCLDYSGEPPWKVKYPVNLPSIYYFDNDAVVGANSILVQINGKLREFIVVECSIIEGYIELRSGPWCSTTFHVWYYNKIRTHDECGNEIIYR